MNTRILTTLLAAATLSFGAALQAEVFTPEELASTASPKEIEVQPKPTKQVAPDLPSEAKGVAGYVRVAFIIDEKGKVVAPRIEKSSDSVFESAALDAIKDWKFKAAEKDGQPVAVRVVLPFRFKG